MLQPYLEAGKIVGTHGIKGELRVEPWCDSPEFLKKFKTLYWKESGEYRPVRVKSARVHKNLALLQLDGVDSIEDGDVLRGRVLYLAREDAKLPKGRYFIADLIGVEVVDADNGRSYGAITDVIKTGANDVYQVTDAQKKNYLLPVIDEIVTETDIEGRVVRIRPIKGIFDDAD